MRALVIAAVLVTSACGGDQKPRPRVEVEWTYHQCLEAADIGPPPRPAPEAAKLWAPPPWMWWLELCRDQPSADAMTVWVRRALRWQRRAWAACGPKPAPDHSGPNQDEGGPTP